MTTGNSAPSVPQFDITAAASNPALLGVLDTFKIVRQETSEERAARLRQEAITMYYGFAKEAIILLSFLVLVIIIGYVCFGIITAQSTAANTEAQKWAMSVISGAASGLLGFLVGKSAKG